MKKDTFELTAAERQVYANFSQLSLPRHTSYPGVPSWSESFKTDDYKCVLQSLGKLGEPVSLYVHVPFCEKLCHYCACNKLIVAKDDATSSDYVNRLMTGFRTEIEMARKYTGKLSAGQVHFGGGTPTYLAPTQLDELYLMLRESFPIVEDAEQAVEVDPRVTTAEHLRVMRKHGVTRLSLGVQDFDHEVQRLVNRVQPFEMVKAFVELCRDMGFSSINFDLIYGLPRQSIESMQRTIDLTLELSPDRIAYYRLAVIPEIFKWQRLFSRKDMPKWETTLALNLLAINRFQDAGYLFIGLDHFAKKSEALAESWQKGTLTRSFQGMTTGAGLSLIGFGPTAIGQTPESFIQNDKDLFKWLKALEAGNFATVRGHYFTDDDKIRRFVIQQLYCYREIRFQDAEDLFGISFADYFANEIVRLGYLIEQRLVTCTNEKIILTEPLGFLLSRVVASIFDAYLPKDAYRNGLSSKSASKVG